MNKRVLISVDVDVHHQVRVRAAERNVTTGQLYEEGVRLLLAQDRTPGVDANVVAQGASR